MSFETTSSGQFTGACALQVCMVATSSSEILPFKRFQEYWVSIDTEKYKPRISDDEVASLVDGIKHDTINYANKYLERKNRPPRDDYREFLELVIIFLGAALARYREQRMRFMLPGAMHHARWMSKVIYSLKIWMFKAQFKLTSKEKKALSDVCVFTIRVYMQAWISAPQASGAPYSDLMLLKSLIGYLSINSAILKSTSCKFSNHLWYLSQELVSLAFFDSQISLSPRD